MNDPESALRNLYMTYIFRNRAGSDCKLSYIDKLRWLGGMEALLQVLGTLPSLILWDYQKTKKKFLFISYTVTENYEDYILRIALKFLKESPNTPGTTFR